jgi:lipopolysaccharide transport system ATP-binding protein
MRQFLSRPIAARGVYPTLYLSRKEFESVALPAGWKRFIVIRDLRDTLVSLYFSLKVSHPLISNNMEKSRGHIQDMPTEQGLLLLIRNVCERYAKQQQSWLGGPDVIYKYEDLLDRDVELFEEILIGHCGLKLSRDRLRAVVIGNRFEAHAGRQRGDEDQGSHKRKGIAGDWRNYFTDGVAKAFKDRFGEHLIATGYEKDNRW